MSKNGSSVNLDPTNVGYRHCPEDTVLFDHVIDDRRLLACSLWVQDES